MRIGVNRSVSGMPSADAWLSGTTASREKALDQYSERTRKHDHDDAQCRHIATVPSGTEGRAQAGHVLARSLRRRKRSPEAHRGHDTDNRPREHSPDRRSSAGRDSERRAYALAVWGSGRPSGTVTFLFTDIEGSTRRWESDLEAIRAALVVHDEVLRSVIDAHGGWLFKHTGDGVCAAFGSAPHRDRCRGGSASRGCASAACRRRARSPTARCGPSRRR